jgi:glycosyltransferase involved in cell wall biosynthesis
MKILFISENYPPHIEGGAEISTSLIASWLAKTNTVSVASFKFEDKAWIENGVTVYPVISKTSVGAKNILSAIKYAIGIVTAPLLSTIRILRLIKELDPDVINIVITPYYFIPIIIGMKLFFHRPIFVDCRDYSLICPSQFLDDELEDPKMSGHGYRCLSHSYQVKNKFLHLLAVPFAIYESFIFNLYKSLLRYTINNFNGVTLVSLSNYVQQQLILNGFHKDKIKVIPNISKQMETISIAQKSTIPTFAYGGRIEKEKGIWDLVAAVEILQKDIKGEFLVKVAGIGSAYNSLKNYLEKNRSLPIVLLGKLKPNEVLELYLESLAIIAPSRWPEPFGRFIQESISTGTPVIGTKAGGITEGVQDGVTGLLVDVGNPKQIATAMRSFIENPDQSHTMGLAMKKQMTNYDANYIGKKRLDLYRKEPLRILQVSSAGYPAGGAPIMVLLLRNQFLKRGYEVKVLSSDTQGEGMFSDYQLKLIRKDSPIKALRHLFYFRSYFFMRKIIKEYRPDIIHFNNVDAFSPSIFFAIGKTPAVMTINGPEEFTTKLLPWVLLPTDYKKDLFDLKNLTPTGSFRYYYYRYIQGPIYRLGLRRVKAFIAPSKYMADAIETDIPKKKIKQIYYGIPLPAYKPLPDNHRILYVGRLEDVKGVDYLIRAFAEVIIKIPQAELRIVGDGNARKKLEQLVADLKLTDHVTFCGWVEAGTGVVREYENALILAVPSIWPEAFGLVCVEALAVGRPVVGAQTGGIPESIQDGKTGYIVPIKNVEALSEALTKLLGSDRQTLELMSKEAGASVDKFSTANFIDNIEALYKDVLNGKP